MSSEKAIEILSYCNTINTILLIVVPGIFDTAVCDGPNIHVSSSSICKSPVTGQVMVGKANFLTASSSITCPLLLTTATIASWYKKMVSWYQDKRATSVTLSLNFVEHTFELRQPCHLNFGAPDSVNLVAACKL